jgi:fused signal recognition particle receptor
MFDRLFRRDPGIEKSVQKTRTSFFSRITGLLQRTQITDDVWDELEEALIGADVGVQISDRMLATVRARHRRGELRSGEDLSVALQEELLVLLHPPSDRPPLLVDGLTVLLMVGVNGVGKTTTVAKLGNYFRTKSRKVMLAAGDTFRAAGAEQLEVWAERINLPCVASQTGADPGSIVYDGIGAARARGCDVLLVDTAGRLHTKTNLMEELRKIRRIVERQNVDSRALLVLDATAGQNGILQARGFADASGLDGIVVTKLDGTAKGGVVFAIAEELGAPVLFVGTGEHVDDLQEFDPEAFVGALFRTDD